MLLPVVVGHYPRCRITLEILQVSAEAFNLNLKRLSEPPRIDLPACKIEALP